MTLFPVLMRLLVLTFSLAVASHRARLLWERRYGRFPVDLAVAGVGWLLIAAAQIVLLTPPLEEPGWVRAVLLNPGICLVAAAQLARSGMVRR